MPVSGDLVPARFYPLGVERTHRIFGGLHGRLRVREVELGLPVRSLGIGECILCQAQLTKCFSSRPGGGTGIVLQEMGTGVMDRVLVGDTYARPPR